MIEWQLTVAPIPCHDGYDVIRGVLPLTADGSTVDLGAVDCIAEDTELETKIDASPGPEPGHGYFYVVRLDGAPDLQTYGNVAGDKERIPSAGDCAP